MLDLEMEICRDEGVLRLSQGRGRGRWTMDKQRQAKAQYRLFLKQKMQRVRE